MVGRDDTALEHRADARAVGSERVPDRPLGSGHAMKALNNFVGAAARAPLSAHSPAAAATVDGATGHSEAHRQWWTSEFAVAPAEA